MSYFRFPHISEPSLTFARRIGAFWPRLLNHTCRSGSFIIVTIISISLTHQSCHKSAHTIFCDRRDQMQNSFFSQLQFVSFSHISAYTFLKVCDLHLHLESVLYDLFCHHNPAVTALHVQSIVFHWKCFIQLQRPTE